jgi:hypothetical protein
MPKIKAHILSMRSISIEGILATWLQLFGFILVLGGIGTLLFQCYVWLRYGSWLPIPLSVPFYYIGIVEPKTGWHGIQIIIDGILAFPGGWGLCIIGSLILNLGAGIEQGRQPKK